MSDPTEIQERLNDVAAWENLVSERNAALERVAELDNALDAAIWYIRCLEDVQDRRPVRGLEEAKAGYDSACDAVSGEIAE